MFVVNKIVNRRRLLGQLKDEGSRSKSGEALVAEEEALQQQGRVLPKWMANQRLHDAGFPEAEIRALQMTWKKLNGQPRSNPQSLRLLTKVFEAMAQHAAVARIQQHNRHQIDNKEHARVVLQLIDSFIDANAFTRLKAFELLDIGVLHYERLARCGFRQSTWEIFGICVVDVFAMQESIQAVPDAKRAWIRLFALFVDRLRATHERCERINALHKRYPNQPQLSLDSALPQTSDATDSSSHTGSKDNKKLSVDVDTPAAAVDGSPPPQRTVWATWV